MFIFLLKIEKCFKVTENVKAFEVWGRLLRVLTKDLLAQAIPGGVLGGVGGFGGVGGAMGLSYLVWRAFCCCWWGLLSGGETGRWAMSGIS